MAGGIRMSARTNSRELLEDLDAFGQASALAANRTLNKVTDQAKVAGLRKINEIYKIGPRAFEKYVTLRLAGPGQFEATISAKGKGLPLYAFSARQTKRGVTVSVKGRTFTIDGAFIARMRSGRIGVFARGGYGGTPNPSGRRFGRFVFGRPRLPIQELFTFGPAEAFSNPEVVQAANARIDEQYPRVYAQELRFARRGRA